MEWVIIKMKRIILRKYGELTTKKDNRGFFIKTLRKNILNKLKELEHEDGNEFLDTITERLQNKIKDLEEDNEKKQDKIDNT